MIIILYDSSITIMVSLSVFINDFLSPFQRVNNQTFQVITVRPVHSFRVF